VDAEERTAAFPTAIATLVEDTAQITLALYIIACHGEREDFVGEFRLPVKFCFMVVILASDYCVTGLQKISHMGVKHNQ